MKIIPTTNMSTPILKNTLPRLSSPQSIFTALVGLCILINFLVQTIEIIELKQQRKIIGYHFLGTNYAGLAPLLDKVVVIGYYTDRDLAKNVNSARFAQAQYTLAPVILNPDSLDYEFILLDCASGQKAVEKMIEMNATLVFINPKAGFILAKKTK